MLGGAAAIRPGSTAADLRVGQSIDLRRTPAFVQTRFHGIGSQLSATGARHQFELRDDGVVRVQRLLAPFPARQMLLARTVGAGLLSSTTTTTTTTTTSTTMATSAALRALELRTVSIARGGYQCVDGAGRFALHPDGSAQRAFASCTERWTNGAQGGEVGFHFAQRPAGAGDLVVDTRDHAPGQHVAQLVRRDRPTIRTDQPRPRIASAARSPEASAA